MDNDPVPILAPPKDSIPKAVALPPYRMVPIDALIPHARNARTHSDAQVAQIAASIREFGFTNPVLIDGGRGIVAGHGRVLAARALGMDAVPTIELSHLSGAQRRAYAIADNKLALNAEWDEDMLRLELGDLEGLGLDMSLTGFAGIELVNMLRAGDAVDDPAAEWQGMPEFDQKDKTAFQTIAVHLKDQAAVDAFARVMGQRISPKTKFVWYPAVAEETYIDKRYATGVPA